MIEKNLKRLEAKKHRMMWQICPRTRIKEGKKKYNRKRDKKVNQLDF